MLTRPRRAKVAKRFPLTPEQRRRSDDLAAVMRIALRALTVDLDAVEQAVIHGKPDRAIRAVDTSRFEEIMRASYEPILREQFVSSAIREAKGGRYVTGKLRKDGKLNLAFTVTNPEADRWAQSEAGRLIVEISDRARASIQGLVSTAVTSGMAPREAAVAIKPLIGLHSQYANAVLRYRASLAETGLSSERVAALGAAYYDKLLTTRSQTIARTEILGAENQGRAATWVSAYTSGLIPGDAMKEWVASGDAEEVCAGLDGTQVGLMEDFNGDDFGDVDMPPLHPNCRCTAVVVLPDGTETDAEEVDLAAEAASLAGNLATASEDSALIAEEAAQVPSFATVEEGRAWLESNVISPTDAVVLDHMSVAELQQVGDEVPALVRSAMTEAQAVQDAGGIASKVEALATEVGGHAEGIAFQYKGDTSLARAIIVDARKLDISYADAAAKLHDALRYTIVADDPANYASVVEQVLAGLGDQGFGVTTARDFWGSEFYNGINLTVETNGYAWEVQVHTAESFYAKETLAHSIYEDLRVLPLEQFMSAADRYQLALYEAELRSIAAGVTPVEGLAGVDGLTPWGSRAWIEQGIRGLLGKARDRVKGLVDWLRGDVTAGGE